MDKKRLTMNPMEKQIIESKKASDNVSFLLIIKVVFVNTKGYTPLQIERANVFQKYYIDILKNHSTRLTEIHHSRHK